MSDYDVMIGALPTKTIIYADLIASLFLKNQAEIKK